MVGTPDHRTRITTLCMSVLWLDNHSVLVLDVRGIKSPGTRLRNQRPLAPLNKSARVHDPET